MSVESVTSDKQQPPPPPPPTATTTSATTAVASTTTITAGATTATTTITATTTATTATATTAVKKEEGDEAIISMSVAGEVTDASIMEVGRSRPQFQYSREDLMLIKNLPLSKRRPTFLDIAYNNSRGVWDPERWHCDRKRSDTPPKEERTGRGDQISENHNKRRNNGDPRDRIRKEQDGIVLSPQRRSFNSGCFVNVNQPPSRRPESPIGKTEVSHREPVRRIGSGRILTRDIWDFRTENEKIESERTDYGFRSGTTAGGSLRDRDNRDSRDGKERDRDRDMRERERDRDRDGLRERDDRFERRSFGRDYGDRGERERDRGDRGGGERNDRSNHQVDRDKDRGREKRFSNDRRRTYSDTRDSDEPEWFSSGPTSQHDTIELRGFEDIPEEKAINSSNAKSKKQTPAQKKRGKRNTTEKDDKPSENSAGPKGRSTPTVMDQPVNAAIVPHSPISEQAEQSITQKKEKNVNENTATEPTSESRENSSANQNQEDSHPDFNLDEFLKSDTFPGVSGLLTNGVGSNSGTGSRFSQWFKRESPVQTDSRRASIQDELLNNLLNDITEPNIQIPSVTESNTYFAPISPANTTNNANTTTNGVKLLEMLHRGNKPNQNGQGDASNAAIPMMKNCSIKDLEVGGKVVHSLEELEARMRGGAPPPATSTDAPRVNKTEEDLSAFKKLLAQVTGGQAVPAANGPITQKQPVTLMQLLNSTQLKTQPSSMPHQQPPVEPIHPTTFNHVGPLGPTQHPHQAQMQHENLMKVLQIQQQQQQQQKQQQQQQRHSDMLSMMMGNQRMLGVSPVPTEMQMMINNVPSSQELLQRPEAQAIIQGLQQGEITRQHLMQQLQNPAMQHRHREVLVNILKIYGGTTPRTISPHPHPAAPIPQDHILQQMLYQQQQQRIPSPMNNVIPHRVPSPREIVMHTQSIMQSALIKKKLEEQRENFRKRQDQQQQQQQVQQQRTSSPVNSPAKQTASPLAFTPTSVLRKMTADKEPDGANQLTQVEINSSITSGINKNVNSRMSKNSQMHTAASSINLSKFSDSVNRVQNETLKLIFIHSAITNPANNKIFDTEESALKTKYLYLSEQKKDIENNSKISTSKENIFLDINKDANDGDAKTITFDVIDVNTTDNDTNNNDSVLINETVSEPSESETLVEKNIMASTSSDETNNVDLQNITLVAISENN